MRGRRGVFVAVAGLALLITGLLQPASAQSTQSAQRTAADGCGVAASSAAGAGTIRFTTPGQLRRAECRTLHGKKVAGGCLWRPPELVLGPDQKALEARQVSTNFSTCTTVVEIGVPSIVEAVPADEQVAAQKAGTTRSGPALTPYSLYNTTRAYTKVTWWDPVGIDVNHVRSILVWTWGQNGCIVGSTAESAVYSQSGTGWSNYYWNWWKTTSCTSHYTHTDADFQNPVFCVPPTYTHYDNVWIRGGYQGGYGGNLDSTWATGGCTYLLHWSYQVVKEWTTS